ncbi:MAG TPA: plasma-membrane proton-efflux P-type ATPase [Bryobacteraceae bacterium]|nr:plasma-membrane proton-efflux P-type ATPase [Bryobacteraceae bacterium]
MSQFEQDAGSGPEPSAPGSSAAELTAFGSHPDTGLTNTEATARLEREGPNEVPEKKSHPFLRFARKFWGLSAWMIELIALLSFILGKRADLSIALALLVVNAVLSFLQEQRASSAVTALRRQLQVTARVLRDGTWQARPAHDLVRGDLVRVRTGDFVPADLRVFEGALRVDQSVLTGESNELGKAVDSTLYSGSIVRQGEATAVVVATGVRTYFGRTTQLVESARPKLHIEEVITRVVKWLFLIVGVLVSVALAASIAEGLRLIDILPLSLVLLMSAVPVALPVMFTVSMAIGSIELARRGLLVTRLSAAEDAANMDVLCADKTGTLTMNRLSLAGTIPQPGVTEDDILRDGALASNEADQDPIDLAFLRTARERGLLGGGGKVVSFEPFSAKSRRTEALVERDGQTVRVMKGALRTLAELAHLESSALAALETQADEQARKGFRVLAVARAEAGVPLRLVGLAFLHDAPRPDSAQLIKELNSLGVTVKMLTGDALPVAREVARELGLSEIISAHDLRAPQNIEATELVHDSGGFAEVFPEDKFLVVKSLQAAGHVVGMTGDGVNDAPALRQAEVGIAVSSASDVAKSAASAVLTTEGLAGIVDLVKNGRAIYQRVLTWIVNKVSRTILKSGFVVIAFLVTGRFVISALGMVLLVFMTDFVKIALSTDRVRPSQKPESWNIGPLVRLAVLLGLLMLLEALGLLALGWYRFNLGNGDGRLQTFTFLTLLFFALLSLVSIRERQPFWSSRPSTVLATALVADMCLGALIGTVGLGELRPLPTGTMAFIATYSLVFSLGVNDLIKSAVIAHFWRPQGTSGGKGLS